MWIESYHFPIKKNQDSIATKKIIVNYNKKEKIIMKLFAEFPIAFISVDLSAVKLYDNGLIFSEIEERYQSEKMLRLRRIVVNQSMVGQE